MYTNFTIQTNKNKDQNNEAHAKWPDYIMRTRSGEEYIDMGVAWKKVDRFNRTYLSCKLSEGFFIDGAKIPFNNGKDKPSDKPSDQEITADDIPF